MESSINSFGPKRKAVAAAVLAGVLGLGATTAYASISAAAEKSPETTAVATASDGTSSVGTSSDGTSTGGDSSDGDDFADADSVRTISCEEDQTVVEWDDWFDELPAEEQAAIVADETEWANNLMAALDEAGVSYETVTSSDTGVVNPDFETMSDEASAVVDKFMQSQSEQMEAQWAEEFEGLSADEQAEVIASEAEWSKTTIDALEEAGIDYQTKTDSVTGLTVLDESSLSDEGWKVLEDSQVWGEEVVEFSSSFGECGIEQGGFIVFGEDGEFDSAEMQKLLDNQIAALDEAGVEYELVTEDGFSYPMPAGDSEEEWEAFNDAMESVWAEEFAAMPADERDQIIAEEKSMMDELMAALDEAGVDYELSVDPVTGVEGPDFDSLDDSNANTTVDDVLDKLFGGSETTIVESDTAVTVGGN